MYAGKIFHWTWLKLCYELFACKHSVRYYCHAFLFYQDGTTTTHKNPQTNRKFGSLICYCFHALEV